MPSIGANTQPGSQSLPPKERAKLKAAGPRGTALPEPRRRRARRERDLADSPLASETPDLLEAIEPVRPARLPRPNAWTATQVWDVLRRLIGELLIQKNAKLSLECLALVSGVSFLGDSMTEIGTTPRRHAGRREQAMRRADRETRPAAVASDALVDGPRRLCPRPPQPTPEP